MDMEDEQRAQLVSDYKDKLKAARDAEAKYVF
jgi:hypothetical protein